MRRSIEERHWKEGNRGGWFKRAEEAETKKRGEKITNDKGEIGPEKNGKITGKLE